MTSIIVTSGQTVSGLVLRSGDALDVQSGGTAIDTVATMASITVDRGGSTRGTQVGSASVETVYGTTSGSHLGIYAHEIVALGGTAVATTVDAAGSLEADGGTVRQAVINEQGVLVDNDGAYGAGTVSGSMVTGDLLLQGSGTIATGTVLSGNEVISAGATARDTIVASTGREVVRSGGTASGTTVLSGGFQFVLGGGSETGTVVQSGGFQSVDHFYVVSAGQTVSGLVLKFGESLEVMSGGTAIDTVVNVGEPVTVDRGGTTRGTIFTSGGTETVFGTANDTILNYQALENLKSGGLASGTTVNENSEIDVNGTLRGAVINDRGYLDIYNGAALGTTVSGGLVQLVSTNALTSGTVLRGGREYVENGGTALDTVVHAGHQIVLNGKALGTTVASGGLQTVNPGGIDSGTTVANGGIETIHSGGIASSTTVMSGGLQIVESAGTASSTIVLSGGLLEVSLGGSDVGTVVEQGGIQYGGSAGTVAPSLRGVKPAQVTTSAAPVKLFAGAVITDNNGGSPNETLTLKQTGSGTLSGIGLVAGSGHTFTLSGTAATVTSELDSLIFTPQVGIPGSSSTTHFALTERSDQSAVPATAFTAVTDTEPVPNGPLSTVGTGPDQLALSLSEDAYQGDALYTVAVDGHQIGGPQFASAAHGSSSDTLLVNGDFGPGDHTVTVDFLNDLYGGTAAADRNLYLDGARYNGKTVSGAQAALDGSGPLSLVFNHTPSNTPTVIGTGPDQLTLNLSEHAFQGDAQYTVSVDGHQIGGPQITFAGHGSGSDTLVVNGLWRPGNHIFTIDYLNDRYGGTVATDRNLYLDGAKYNGATVTGAQASFYGHGSQSFIFHAAAVSS